MDIAKRIFWLALLCLMVLLFARAEAAEINCADAPAHTFTTDDNVKCDQSGATDLDLTLTDKDINSTENGKSAIHLQHGGTGNINLDVTGGSLTASGTAGTPDIGGRGIFTRQLAPGAGALTIDLDVSSITASQDGIYIERRPTDRNDGTIDLTVKSDSITATGGAGIFIQQNKGATNVKVGDEMAPHTQTSITSGGGGDAGIYMLTQDGNDTVEVHNVNILQTNTGGNSSSFPSGIRVLKQGEGDINIDFRGGSLEVMGKFGGGIVADHDNHSPSLNAPSPTGNININVQRATITTPDGYTGGGCNGACSPGIFARIQKDAVATQESDITITTQDTDITTSGRKSRGTYVQNYASGDVKVEHIGGSTTINHFARGIFVDNYGTGDIEIITDGHTITTTRTGSTGRGASDGIRADQNHDTDRGKMDITVGGDIRVDSPSFHGVRFGGLSSGAPVYVANVLDGFREQTVNVDAAISTAGVALGMHGGGRVVIGPKGSLESGKGIVILSSGTVPEDSTDPMNVIPAIHPDLHLTMHLDGRSVREVLKGNHAWIINDGGTTTIVVSGTEKDNDGNPVEVLLHDENGVAVDDMNNAVVVHNGVYDLTMVLEGEDVSDYTDADPMNWVKTGAATGQGRDFSTADFTEHEVRCPPGQRGRPPNCSLPPPPVLQCPDGQTGFPPNCEELTVEMCPEGEVGTPPDCEPEPEPELDEMPEPDDMEPPGHEFVETFAPRAAIYEALPGLLLGMNSASQGLMMEKRSAWIRAVGSRGSMEADRSTVGQDSDTRWNGVQIGKAFTANERTDVAFALHSLAGEADVDAETRGGDVDIDALGASAAVRYHRDAFYLRAEAAASRYDIDMRSDRDTVGTLKNGGDATGAWFMVEAGRHVRWGGLVPKVWLSRSSLSVDDFTDSVGAEISVSSTDTTRLGVGVLVQRENVTQGGILALEADIGVSTAIGDSTTDVDVSGTRLSARAQEERLHLGLGASFDAEHYLLSANVAFQGSGSDDSQVSAGLNASMRF